MSELNRTVVLAFYTAALVEKNAEAAVRLVSESYKQHNPNIEDGSSGLRKFITWYARQYPKSTATVNRSFVDGDFVILDAHVVRCPGELGSAVADIFRLENGTIVEHWDRIQAVPETSKNGNSMF